MNDWAPGANRHLPSKTMSISYAVRSAITRQGGVTLSAAAAAFLSTASVHAGTAEEAAAARELPEITVTAEKRTESLQDVPYNITAVPSEALSNAGQLSMNDLTEIVPGLQTVDQGPAARAGNNNFVLRGLRSDSPGGGSVGALYHNLSASSISTYYGETPVYFQMPTVDIERVEVLRGPQGTLYGSGATAGTMRFVPNRPAFDSVSGQIYAAGSYTYNSSAPNGSFNAVLNLPVADHLALRLVAGEEHVAGFIDAVDRIQFSPGPPLSYFSGGVPTPSIPGDLASGFVLGPVQRATNGSDQWFGKASLRWQPVDNVDLQVDYLHQHTKMKDSQWGSDWPGGPFDSSFGSVTPPAIVNTRAGCTWCTTNWAGEPYSNSLNLVDLVASADVGLATVTSATSYYDSDSDTTLDQTGAFYGIPYPPNPNGSPFIAYPPYYGYPRIVQISLNNTKATSLIQEVRATSKPGKVIDYVVGLYYEHQINDGVMSQGPPGSTAYRIAIGKTAPVVPDTGLVYTSNNKLLDKAVFGELTFHITKAWQFTGGARIFHQDISNYAQFASYNCGAPCSTSGTDPSGVSSTEGSTGYTKAVFKANTSYDLTPELKVYLTYSEGFRHGGLSGYPVEGPFASKPELATFAPDLTTNYEAGVKGTLFNRRVRFFADLYRMDTDKFQIDTANLSAAWGATNGSKSRSDGLELEIDAAVTEHLTLVLGYAYTDAYVVTAFNTLDYLPFALPSVGGSYQTAPLFGGPIPAGTPMPGISKNIASVSGDYTVPVGAWELRFHGDVSYRSSQNSALLPDSFFGFVIPSATILNASLTAGQSDGLSYQLFVRNITNNADITGGEFDQLFPNPYRLRNVGTPRTVGIGLTYRFGGSH